MRIVFMGTPDFAVPSLDILVQNGYDVVGVVTAPDKPAGRGQKLQQSAVKRYAESRQLNILQPEKLKNADFLAQLHALQPDLAVVVAFRMLPASVFSLPRWGTFNLHASLLPQYRGAAPINWALINGDTQTGVTTFFIEEKIDTGNIILQQSVPISPQQTAGELHDQLMHIGAGLVLQTVQSVANGSCKPIPQQAILSELLRPAPKIFTDTCHILWQQSAADAYNLIRGLSPYPAAFTTIEGKVYKIFATQIVPSNGQALPKAGSIATDHKTYLHIATSDAWLAITEWQAAGKKRLPIADFLRGNSIGATAVDAA